MRWVVVPAVALVVLTALPSAAHARPAGGAGGTSFLSDLSLHDLTMIVAGIGVFGALLIVIGVVALRRSRAARRASIAP
ncbi:hypothetical protein Daura_33885 [Dactylosporangium aurantiacum]|uniref:Uncharacterized protein n=1 Tax=Dactylosporangium aurantiacum TaxID=35754 RepID=A0A9Q9I963_9ACTN|nr:hypothetical protein [Dactylosporangium aurantiacum]MDG6105185.1 hypothetical protein [Dactylosporangium aurantiacum]UWZ51707.1 hypothetical protein Daura_33885 [Dactylosporangium aurantiacum]